MPIPTNAEILTRIPNPTILRDFSKSLSEYRHDTMSIPKPLYFNDLREGEF